MHRLMFAALFLIAGCAAESRVAPVSTSRPFGYGPSPDNKAPESPNALPNGSAVDAPFVPAYGTVGTSTPGRGY